MTYINYGNVKSFSTLIMLSSCAGCLTISKHCDTLFLKLTTVLFPALYYTHLHFTPADLTTKPPLHQKTSKPCSHSFLSKLTFLVFNTCCRLFVYCRLVTRDQNSSHTANNKLFSTLQTIRFSASI